MKWRIGNGTWRNEALTDEHVAAAISRIPLSRRIEILQKGWIECDLPALKHLLVARLEKLQLDRADCRFDKKKIYSSHGLVIDWN